MDAAIANVSRYLPSDPLSMLTFCHILHIWQLASHRPYFFLATRLASFACFGFDRDDNDVRQLAELGFFATSADDVTCFACGLKCRWRQLLSLDPGGRTNPACPLQAARVHPLDGAMFADYLSRSCLPKLPSLASLAAAVTFLTDTRGQQVLPFFPADATLLCLAELFLEPGGPVGLAAVQPATVIARMLPSSIHYPYPSLDNESTFTTALCHLFAAGGIDDIAGAVVDGGGGIFQYPVDPFDFPGGMALDRGPAVTAVPVYFGLD